MRLLRMVVMLAGTIVVVSFSVVNRADVEISFFPLPVAPFDFPVYGVMLFGLALGILTGGLTLWLSTAPMRREWRDLRRRFRARRQWPASQCGGLHPVGNSGGGGRCFRPGA